jgi:6-phosphogluconolactonase (cycloisomerase 2 family)
MRMHAGGALLLSIALATGLALTAPVAAGAHPRGRVVGHVYVNANTAGTNTVAGFAEHAGGGLTPLPGSPFSIGGAGTGTPIGSQGAIQVTGDGRYLLAVDAGSNQISVARIGANGAVWQHGTPVSSYGTTPVSLAVHGRLVYVANLGDGTSGANYTGFRLDGHARLVHLSGSTVWLPPTANPGDILFNRTGRNLIGIEVGTTDPSTFLIDSFRVGRYGRLHAAAGSPFAAEAPGPFGSEFSPTNPSRLYVSNAHGGTDAGVVSAFHVARDGDLSAIGASPYADHQTAPCWVEISHDGRFLFAVDTGSSTISSYRIRRNGTMSYLRSVPISSPSARAFDARLDVWGTHLYVVENATNAVGMFRVHGGNVTELGSSPAALPAGSSAFGIVAT